MKVGWYWRQLQWGLTFPDRETGVWAIIDLGPLEIMLGDLRKRK